MHIWFEVDDVMRLATTVVGGGYFHGFGRPRCRSYHILLISRLFDHLVEQVLEGSLLRRRILTDVVGGVLRETLRIKSKSVTV